MPDIIVKQQPTTSLTVQSNSTQLLIRQAAANNITVSTTGNSYILPAATNSTLGGIIVGPNLSISNGVLSACIPPQGVTAFNGRTGNVTLTANDVFDAAKDSAKSNASLYVRTSSIAPGLTTALANYPNGPQGQSFTFQANYPNAPYFNNATVWVNGSLSVATASTSNANQAARDVGSWQVTFLAVSNLPQSSWGGTTTKQTGVRLTHFAGVPYLSYIGQPQFSAYADVNAIGLDYILTKSQMLLLFYTRQQIDQILLNYQRIN